MQREDEVRLRHMLDAAQEAIGFAKGRERADLDTDRMLVLSLLKALEIVGEAATQVNATSRVDLPTIPWDDVIGMRHRLVHAYFDVDLDIVWQTVRRDLPGLVSLLETLSLD
jgi:uncharacterized protein with HEPN domain